MGNKGKRGGNNKGKPLIRGVNGKGYEGSNKDDALPKKRIGSSGDGGEGKGKVVNLIRVRGNK